MYVQHMYVYVCMVAKTLNPAELDANEGLL